MSLVAGAVFLALFVLGTPLFICIGALTLLLLRAIGMDPQVVAIEVYRIARSPGLVAISMFAFAGVVMARSGMPGRFVDLAKALVGWIPGAAAIVTLTVFETFTALTGASGMSILAVGGMLYGVLRKAGYPDRFSLGMISSAGSLGVLLPPSIVIIFYGTLTSTPIDVLFKAGLLPSAVMLGVLGTYCVLRGMRAGTRTPFSWSRLAAATWATRYEIPLPFLVLGGAYTGIITIAEIACITALYVLVVETVVYGDVPLRKAVGDLAVETMMLVGAIVVVLAVALGLNNVLVDQGIPERLVHWSAGVISSRVGFLLALNLLLLAMGCMLDVFSALILAVPLLTPLAMSHGIHPVHLGIIFLANLEVGYSTPPVGLNLFVASLTFKRPLLEVMKSVLPFVLLLLLGVLIITFIPQLSTWPTAELEGLTLPP